MLEKYNYSYKKFFYFNFIGPILGIAYIFINKYILDYLYKSFLHNKKFNLIILRSFIDFYYSKQNEVKKRQLDNKLFFYNTFHQENSFLFYHNNFKKDKLTIEVKNLSIYLEKFKNFNFRNICQIGSSGGKNLEYFSKKFNFKNKIYSDIDDTSIRLAKQKFKNSFNYFKCGAQDVHSILQSSLYNDNNEDSIDLFISIGSISYCSPVMLKDFFNNISKAKSKTFLLISEPIEIDFLSREKSFESRKIKSFNYKYDLFCKETNIKILKKIIHKLNIEKKDKYLKNIASFILIAQIN